MNKIRFLLLIPALISVDAWAQSTDEIIIRDILDRQVQCWNKGDLECFMKGYRESDQLMFIGGSGIIYGFENTLRRYKERYPDLEAMGELKFELKEMKRVAESVYFVVGEYVLTREPGNLSGHFSLLWQKIDGEWFIVADHSSEKQ